MKLLLLSTSRVYGAGYLDYCEDWITRHFQHKQLTFIPYARPGGLTYDQYTNIARNKLVELGYAVTGVHEYADPNSALASTGGIFIGGGNTFLLLKTLVETGVFQAVRTAVADAGVPYMGASAGSNVAGQSICTTNDMPIVYPPQFESFGFIPFNINPHYLDPVEGLKHMGETRETRIKEFHTQQETPVVGLREGSALQVLNGKISLLGQHTARIFRPGREPTEWDASGHWQDLAS